MNRLTGKAALITGASSGIGAAIARCFADEGAAALLLTGREAARLEEIAAACHASGAAVQTYVGDLAREEHVSDLVKLVPLLPAPLDILVNNAAVFAEGTVEATPPAEFERQWRVNTWAPYALTHALLPALKETRGQVVFVNSGAGATAHANYSAYCASKFALRALADSLRAEVAPHGVRVLSAMLGKTATPMQEKLQLARNGTYDPGQFPSAEDAAELIITALALPPNAELTEFSLRPQYEVPR